MEEVEGKQPQSNKAATELFILSFLSLFIELLVIRWMSADVRAFTIFRTFPLVSCYVGLGLGFAVPNDKPFLLTILALLQFVYTMKMAEIYRLNQLNFISSDYWSFQGVNVQNIDPIQFVSMTGVLLLLLAGPFLVCLCLGSRLGTLFKQIPPLKAYLINLAGALVGSLVFGLLCYLCIAPSILIALAAALIVPFGEVTKKALIVKTVVVALIAVVPWLWMEDRERTFVPQMREALNKPIETMWSPYCRIDLRVREDEAKKEFQCLELSVNHSHQQYYFKDTIPTEDFPKPIQGMLKVRREHYDLPFRLVTPKDVLIVGSGTGQNIWNALQHGAERVDAVEIDPVTIGVGKKYNPNYSSDRVHVTCTDARYFFRTTKNKYDVIILPILDSQTVIGQGSSVRTDSYVFTKESIQQALSLLKENGILLLAFGTTSTPTPWPADRLNRTLEAAAGYKPLLVRGHDEWDSVVNTFILGQSVKNKTLQLPESWHSSEIEPVAGNRPIDDDWPYLYLAPNLIDIPYLIVVGLIVVLSAFFGRKVLNNREPGNWQMFFLGSGFLLLELHAISLLALLYGSTWVTSAMVINGILILIMAANLIVMKATDWLQKNQSLIYGLLFGSILVSFLIPAQSVLNMFPDLPGTIIITIITLMPMCIAGLIFPCALARASDPARAMGFNLFGSVIGGLLEYLSNFFGIKSLELVALALYALSFIAALRALKPKAPSEAP